LRSFAVFTDRMMTFTLAAAASCLLVAALLSGCDEVEYYYEFAPDQYTTRFPEPVQLHVNKVTRSTDTNLNGSVSDATDTVTSWSVEPAKYGTVDSAGVFRADVAGTYKVTATFPQGFMAEATVTVTPAPQANPSQGGGRYPAKLSSAPCVSSSPDRNRMSEEANLVFTVNGEDINIEVTDSDGIRSYHGSYKPSDGTFSITSDNPASTIQVVGTLTNSGVSGVWTTTFADGDLCVVTFKSIYEHAG